MSIENNLERIATALEAIAKFTPSTFAQAIMNAPLAPEPLYPDTVPAIAAPIKLQPGESVAFAGGVLSNPAGAPPAPAPASVAPPVPAAPTPAPVVQMTAEELDNALQSEMVRINSHEPIVDTIRKMGYSGVRAMPTSLYGELLRKIREIPSVVTA